MGGMRAGRTVGRLLTVLIAGFLLGGAGGCLNPDLVNSTAGGLVPTAPGDTQFLLVLLVNDTDASLDGTVNVDDGGSSDATYGFKDLTPNIYQRGFLIPWPVLRVGLGPLDTPVLPSMTATFDNGLTVQVPFNQFPLVATEDFERGDTVIFRITQDSRSPTFITISPGRINGATQQGPFTRSDTFEVVQLLLLQAALANAP